MKTSTDIDLDELDKLYAEATTNAAWTIHNAYPALSARLRELEGHLAVVYSDEVASDNTATTEARSLRAWQGAHEIWDRCGSLARHQIRHARHRIEKLRALLGRSTVGVTPPEPER